MAIREMRGIGTSSFDQEPITYDTVQRPRFSVSGRVTRSGVVTQPIAPLVFPVYKTDAQDKLRKPIPVGRETAESLAETPAPSGIFVLLVAAIAIYFIIR